MKSSKIKKPAPASVEQFLLTLAIECLEAKELITGIESVKKYFATRFQSETIDQHEVDLKQREIYKFPKERGFFQEKGNFYFYVPFTVPLVFCLKNPKGEEPSHEEVSSLEKIAIFFREKLESISELRGLTYTDDLTGLYNQRYLELVLDRELSLAKRGKNEFSVLFLDLDHFKQVNDTHGHIIGSRLLFEVSQEIKRALRDTDITFRYGGDEFVAILSQTGLDSAMQVAERIRVQVEKKRFLIRDGMEIRMTTSIGVATVPIHASTKKEILTVADQALYGVKKSFRNKVIAASDILVQAQVHNTGRK